MSPARAHARTRTPARRAAAALAALALPAATLLGLAPRAAAAPGPSSAPQYYFDQWDVPSLWAGGARGQGVLIAELDTGVNAALPELAGRVLPGIDLGSAGGDGRTDRATDAFGHGTAMASIMVASPGTFGITGLAPDATILPVAVPLEGTSDVGNSDLLPQAIRYAADHGAKIISMSLGGTRTPANAPEPCPDDEQDAVFYALSKGAVLVAASGNGGREGSPVTTPGVCLGVVSVGATDRDGDVAPFSSQHPYLTMSAPGAAIASLSRIAGTGYAGDGTSQATAITSAALALAWSAHPELDGPALVTRLLATLQPGAGQTAGTHSNGYGYGRLAADRLVRDTVPADAGNVVYAAAAPFIAQYAAGSAPQASPPPSGSPAPTTTAAVGRPPRLLGPTFVLACVGAAAGLLVLVAALLLRRRLRPARVGVGPPGAPMCDSEPAPSEGNPLAGAVPAGSAPAVPPLTEPPAHLPGAPSP